MGLPMYVTKRYDVSVGRRVLAANFGQIPKPKHESDEDDDGSDNVSDDGSSLYLSAKEDSDSTGFLSAIGSRSNLRLTGRFL